MADNLFLRVGDWIEVRSIDEVMATLDERCCLDGLPFMPEMVQYCGGRFQVVKSAHKTCDPTGNTNLRRMSDAVHLDTRCDGRAHGGCEARCLLFWKTAWLKRVDGPGNGAAQCGQVTSFSHGERLSATTTQNIGKGARYCCQATQIVHATKCLSAAHPWPYVQDIAKGNVGGSLFVRHLATELAKAFLAPLARALSPAPGSRPHLPPPPLCSRRERALNLQPGEFVTVRSAEEILSTLDASWKNRGLTLEREMLRHCGGTYRVLCRVGRIIDERTGKMIRLANDCIVLEGVTCKGLDNRSRLFCSRSPYYYWREAWLERAMEPVRVAKEITPPA